MRILFLLERNSFVYLRVLPPHLQKLKSCYSVVILCFFHVVIHSRSYDYVHQVETIARYSFLCNNGEVLTFR